MNSVFDFNMTHYPNVFFFQNLWLNYGLLEARRPVIA